MEESTLLTAAFLAFQEDKNTKQELQLHKVYTHREQKSKGINKTF